MYYLKVYITQTGIASVLTSSSSKLAEKDKIPVAFLRNACVNIYILHNDSLQKYKPLRPTYGLLQLPKCKKNKEWIR